MEINLNDEVIFKQKTARHLAVRSNLPWEYEKGTVVHIDEEDNKVNVCWLQGYHSRNDDVPVADVVAAYDPNEPLIDIGHFSGCSRVLQEIVEEGTI